MRKMEINRNKLYLSTMDGNAYALARQYGLGLELVEYCTAWNLDEKFRETDAGIREKLAGTERLILHGPFSELFPCAIDPAVRQVCKRRFLQTAETARSYGCRRIVVHGGYNPYIYFPVWYREQSPGFWRELLEELPEDMTLCVENVLEPEPGLLGEVLRQVDDPRLRMCLDIGHAHAYTASAVAEWMESCRDVIAHFHIHNNDGRVDTHGSPLQGTIPMEEVLRGIPELCPEATVTLEMRDAAAGLEYLTRRELLG